MKKALLTILATILLTSCSRSAGNSQTDYNQGDTLTIHSTLLTLVELPDGSMEATIANPWREGDILQKFLMVHSDSAVNTDLPVVRIPIERAGVFSSVHTGGLKELGALNNIRGVADAAYFSKNDTINSLLKSGKIVDLGSSQAPSVELIAAEGIDVVLRSPMEGIAASKLPTHTYAIEMADYMETSPIGRAEWILLLGALTGHLDEAKTLLDEVVNDYADLNLKATMAQTPNPKVLTETEQSGVWFVPGTKSYMARFITDAGGRLPWADDGGATGSVPMSLEAVAAQALDADVWLVRNYGSNLNATDLAKMNTRYEAFKAVKDNNVWSSNTAEVPLFDDIAFHPERLLADYVAIFHPEVLPEHQMNYFLKSR